MTTPDQPEPPADVELRRRAEARLPSQASPVPGPRSEHEAQRLVHELQVHQIELEMQNEELRTSRAQLEAGLLRYTALYDFAPVGYFTLDRWGTITQLNLAGARLLGGERTRLLGKRFAVFVGAAALPAFKDFFAQLFAAAPVAACELELERQDESPRVVIFEATLSPDQSECHAVVAEITARKAAEVARAALEARLRVSQKMEAIGTLASGIAHDFNNILGAIYGYTELARYDASDNPAVLDSLDEVTKASERAATLIRQILTFSRQEEQQRQELQLTPLLLEALKLLRAVVPSCVVFQLALAPDARPVLANPTQIHQIMMNLGTNAAHAMRGQPGRVTVTLANCTVDAKLAAAIPELRPGPHVRLSVSDTGHGMEQATADRVFDPFFTTKSPTEGTGLGLSVVHGIMRSSKGAITVKSQLGQGTTFDLYFPALLGTLPAAVGVIPAVPRGHGERILFVDDEEALGNFVKRMLERLGYVVEVERRPQGALNAVQARPEAYALVITDLTMPELLGTELARQLHQLKPGLPILLTSGYAADLAAASLAAVGIVELLNKPFSFEALGQAVYRALQK